MEISTIIGSIAAVMTTGAFLPQALKVIKTKHTKDLSLLMYVVMSCGVLFWLIYGIMLVEMPLILANSVTLVLTLIILGMKLKYK